MAWRFSIYLVPTFLAGVVAVVLAGYAWRKRDQRAAVPFVVMMVGLAVWSFGYGVELGFTTIEPMLRWDQVAFVGSVIVPTAWLLLAVEYAGYEEWITPRTLGALAVEPAVTLALVWSNDVHGLIWRETAVDASGPILVPELTFGPAYWANLAYSYLLVVVGIVLVASVVPRAGRIYRRQSLVLLSGVAAPLGANVLFNVLPAANPVPNLDLTPFAFVVTGVFYALALFRFRMLDLAPTARETLVEAMDDGIVVADPDGRIVDWNPAARRALGVGALGGTLRETPIGTDDGVDEGVVELDVGEGTRTYEVSTTDLYDFRGDVVGRFVLLRDVTELEILRDHEQRLSVLNRLLRHNLRNEVNVIAGANELLASSVDGEDMARIRTIEEAVGRMLGIGEKARHLETTVGSGRSATVAVDVVAAVTEVAEELAEAHPAATVRVDAPDAAWAAAAGHRQLVVALENLGENAVEHNPGESPTVAFRVERGAESVALSVEDDGPGIPEAERAALSRDRETQMAHASGLGLWLVRWIVDASDGELAIETDPAEGSVVTITLARTAPPERVNPADPSVTGTG